jgi:hypothetical protein
MNVMERSENMVHRYTKTLSALLLMLATLPALAGQADNPIFGQPVLKLVQLSPDERRALRDRWEQASPEERVRMRQFFQDRLRQLPSNAIPPVAREAMRLPFPGNRERDDKSSLSGPPAADGNFGFGFGFEKRHSERGQADRSDWPGNRRYEEEDRR